MAAKNMKQLEQMILKEMRKSMTVASEKMLADMYGETEGFYTGGEPKYYKRTGALGDTPRTTAVSTNGNTVEFKAYLDQTHKYTKNRSMTDVLNYANRGINVAGRAGFWNRSEEKMRKTFYDTMEKFFP